MNFSKLTKQIIKFSVLPSIEIFSGISSLETRNRIREALLSFRSSLPRAMMIERGETVLEVGTPYPDTIRELSLNVGREGSVVVVEPGPDNIGRLRKTIEEYSLDNVELIEKAAWDTVTTLELKLAAYSDDHKVELDGVEHDNDYRPENTYKESVSVTAEPVDQILEQLGISELDYMTVAVNGAEMKVLQGAEATLRRSSRLRLFVKGHARMGDGEPINRKIREYLEERGYRSRIAWPGEQTVAEVPGWDRRAGNVFAYKMQE